jgi:hypothetical protein
MIIYNCFMKKCISCFSLKILINNNTISFKISNKSHLPKEEQHHKLRLNRKISKDHQKHKLLILRVINHRIRKDKLIWERKYR